MRVSKMAAESQDDEADSHFVVSEETSLMFSNVLEEDIDKLEEMSKKFDFSQKNQQGATALHIAVDNEKQKSFKFLIDKFQDVNIKDNEGMTALHYAVLIENDEMIQILLEKGADPNITDNSGQTVYDLAQVKQREIIDNYLINKSI